MNNEKSISPQELISKLPGRHNTDKYLGWKKLNIQDFKTFVPIRIPKSFIKF
jgi:hypothetical protein